MNFLFLMDPLETVKMEKDTSFILMLEAHRRGHKVYFATDGDLAARNGKLSVLTNRVVPQRIAAHPFTVKEQKTLDETSLDAVFVRSDPPFDQQYLLNTWLLDLLPHNFPVINNAAGIRSVNEKIWA